MFTLANTFSVFIKLSLIFFFRFEESKMKFQFPYHSLWPYDKFDQQSPQEEKIFGGVIFCVFTSRPEVLFASFFILSRDLFFFPFHTIPEKSLLSGQQEAKLKTNNFWISNSQTKWMLTKKWKERKKERVGERPKGRKGQLRDLEEHLALEGGKAASFDVGGLFYAGMLWDILINRVIKAPSQVPANHNIISDITTQIQGSRQSINMPVLTNSSWLDTPARLDAL